MLKIARILIVTLCCILICVLGTIYSFIRFKNPSNVGIMARWFGRLYPLFGLDVEHRFPQNKENMPRCIYIGNHQNNFDMVTISYMVLPRTVSVGKKSLIWIPFFGILYWVTGNIFLDRENRSKAHSTMTELARRINEDIVPVVCSTTHNKIDLNRWDNGKVICEMMDPIDVSSYTKDNVRELATYCHDLMEKRIAELDAEIAQGK